MSVVQILPRSLKGCLCMPPSKSAAHRAILCAALAKGSSRLSPIAPSNDILVTMRAAEVFGAKSSLQNNVLELVNTNCIMKTAEIDCGESGSSLRFLIPICAALGVEATFTGRGRLPQRPIGIYAELLPKHGVSCKTVQGLPFSINGALKNGEFKLAGNISSQFITGLLLALPMLEGDSAIVLSSPLESAAYVDMTLEAMEAFGVKVFPMENGWRIPGGQQYVAGSCTVEGDWSQAAFFLAAAALGGEIRLDGLKRDSVQGDRAAEELFSQFGAHLNWKGECLYTSSGGLRAITIDASQIPDLVPILAATAALAQGVTHITHAERLRVKESDRLAAMAEGLNRLGARVTELPDGLVIEGVSCLHGGEVQGYNDHRVVMSLAMAALRADGPVTITDAQSIQKSYPNFFEDYSKLGGAAHVLDLGNED